ncbi:hypothetical protein HPB48_017018 [Haemaphysalis longicornis]|uniref:G-protein coupled receptors family 2 profile 2 domain-containing protein n=1 Tax=Haemaphysalis longicornis TaxID=44386 RepID=A0A9J6FPG0_HAELO|nr:hypothetical protein HPB48_017018 [Haemaphysalis longicornis]
MSGATKAANHASGSGSHLPITTAQVRGAFTVMTLLGVTWIFGVFAVGEARTVFQYVFCVCNSMQGFLIFVVRVLQYPEARAAWTQLVGTGTFKKHRGSGPPAGSWCANSNPKQNSHSSMVRVMSTSTDSTSTVVFNSNIWNKGGSDSAGAVAAAGDRPTRLSRFSGVGSLLKNCNLHKDDKKTNTSGQSRKKSPKIIGDEPDAKENHKEFYSSEGQVTAVVPDLYAGQEQQIYTADEARAGTLSFAASPKAHILFAYADGEPAPVQINGMVHSPMDRPNPEPFSTFRRPSPLPSTPKIPELPQSWAKRDVPPSESEPVQNSIRATTEETAFLTPNGTGTVLVS